MRSEAEIEQMIDELRKIGGIGGYTAMAVIAALQNVLHGPRTKARECACLGPAGCCPCQMVHLASSPKEK